MTVKGDPTAALGIATKQSVEPQVTAPYERYFDVTSPYGQRSGGQVVGQPADNTSGGGGGLAAADLAGQAGARLPGALEQLNRLRPAVDSGDISLPFGTTRGAGTRAMQEANPDVPAGIFTGNFARPESNDPYGKGFPTGVVNGPYELPDRTPPAPGWGEWFNNLGKYMCTPISGTMFSPKELRPGAANGGGLTSSTRG